MPRWTLRGPCVLLVLALTGCDSVSRPAGVEGRYTVYTVNGLRPPVAVWGHWAGGRVEVVDAGVRLRANGQASVEVATRVVAADSTVGAVERISYGGTFHQSGDLLTLGIMESAEGRRVRAEGVVLSAREVVVTLHVPGSPSMGYFSYPVSIIARR